jgi:hypothetical protein
MLTTTSLARANRNGDNLLVAEFRKHCTQSSLTISPKPDGVGVVSQPWMPKGEASGFPMRIAATKGVSLCMQMKG